MAARRRTALGGLIVALILPLLAGVPVGAADAPVPGRISTFAGGFGFGPATEVSQQPSALAVHGSTLYVLELWSLIRAVDLQSGAERVVAAVPFQYASSSPQSPFGSPEEIAVDPGGNLYVRGHYRLARVDAQGKLVPVLGNGESGVSPDGTPALEAKGVDHIAISPSGTLYFADQSRVRKVDASGRIVTIAGGLGDRFGDGIPATEARLNPFGITVDANENVYIADSGRWVHRVDAATGMIWHVAGDRVWPPCGDDCPAVDAHLDYVRHLTVTPAGDLLISDSTDYRVRKVDASGIISTLAGTGAASFSGDGGPADLAALLSPDAVTTDRAGHVYIADENRVRRVTPAGGISTIAGNGTRWFSGDGRAANSAQLSVLGGVTTDRAGNVYIVDAGNNRIRKVDAQGRITSIAGAGEVDRGGFSGDGGPATAARIDPSGCPGILIDPAGSVLFADTYNNRIRKIDGQGMMSTVAGSGAANGPDDPEIGDGGAATEAKFASACGLALDAAGNLYISDSANHRVRKVDRAGTITTVAGSGDTRHGDYTGDGGPATAARLNYPAGLAFDGAGRLHIADLGNNVIRRVDGQGTITTVVGRHPVEGPFDPASPTNAVLDGPVGIVFDTAGNLYFSEYDAYRVRRVTPAGGITTVAGAGVAHYSAGDGGPAARAAIVNPRGIAIDAAGSMYVAEVSERVRRIEAIASYMPPVAPTTTSTVAPTTSSTVAPTTSSTVAPTTTSTVAPTTTSTTVPATTTTTRAPTTTTTTAPPPAKVALQSPYSVWVQPTAAALDGIGTWIVPLNDPTARPGQLAPAYLYGHAFSFANSAASGVVGLSTGPAGKFALFSVKGPDGKSYDAAIRFDWQPGRFYFPLVQQTGPGQWVAMVYDHTAAKWVLIGQLSLPSTWGKLAPTTFTIVGWAGDTATSCASYPRADLFVYPTIGYSAGTVATLASSGNSAGGCAGQASAEGGGWVRYQAGTA